MSKTTPNEIYFRTPWPPSANHYLRRTRRATFRTSKTNLFRDIVWAQARLSDAPKLTGDVSVEVLIYPQAGSKRSIDVDNVAKVLLDALQAAGVLENDRQVKRLLLEVRDPDPIVEHCQVTIRERSGHES